MDWTPIRGRLAAVLALALASGACAPASPPGTRVASSARWFGSVTPPADRVFRFALGAEPEVTDPGRASGQPDGRVCRLLFEGLTREDPQTLEPTPGQAERWEVSADGRTYTFHLRQGLRWSDGRPLTAEDFRWSWIRVLRPATASRNAGLLYPILNAENFNRGLLQDERFVGIEAPDDSTLVVTLIGPTAYFLHLTQYYTFFPVPRGAIEAHGERWTRPEHVVSNGAFRLRAWRQNDRFEFVKSASYWDAANVKLAGIVAYTVDDLNTITNLYKAGRIDWCPSGYMPSQFVPYLRGFEDFRHGRYQAVYYYSVNVTRPPFDNVWVRRALNWSVDRDAIANDLLKRSRDPWGNYVPSGYPEYVHPDPIRFDPAYARECLARAGFPGGKGFPKLSILINTSEDHRRIAEAIQAMWTRELGIPVELSNQEWGSYLAATTGLRYDVARRSWIGDYLDPNSFLACFVEGDGNNRTGWTDRRYDDLIRAAAFELDHAKRMELLRRAEALLLADGPVIPIYHYATNELVKPYVKGLFRTALDVHPLTRVEIDPGWSAAPSPTAAAPGARASRTR